MKSFWGCRFCRGKGCLACGGEANRQYKNMFPDGPKPVMTISKKYRMDLAIMQDDGCPNVNDAAEFEDPTGNDEISRAVRMVLRTLKQQGEQGWQGGAE